MLDIRTLRQDPETARAKWASRGLDVDVSALIALDDRRRALIAEVEGLQRERNSESKRIGQLKKAGEDAEDAMRAVREIGERITALDQERSEADAALNDQLMRLPNFPHDSVPVGADAAANPVIREWGAPKVYDFEPLAHWEVAETLGIFEFQRAAALSGAGFACLTGSGARLSRALISFMLDLHTTKHGYTEVQAPFLVNDAALLGTGQLPKFAEDLYKLPADDLWLIPTAEVPLTNLYRDHIFEEALPVNLTGYTPCFRREAGAAGKMTRGMNRLHQFDKVEMVKFARPEDSYAELETLTGHAEAVLQALGLHYRVITLCTGDLGFSSAKTYDIELWAPGQNAWLEVSSCSNFEDYQARRAKIRYRNEAGKPELVHTLNGSGVALPRLIVAILEQNQRADGRVMIPEALRPYMGGVDIL
ncbi:MAG: serine--tRNA ligase [Verrucomicrobia bacterium]|nr:serine--tRNA ligase [Verrucomicrobiota bacterium]MCH8528233.1 serine--tRNA ligase [Kiritimatiellia bacterium]